jgi:hypothetical protein
MRKDLRNKILELISELENKGVLQMPLIKVKHVVAEFFGHERHKVNFVMDHLDEIGFIKRLSNCIVEFDFEVGDKYRKDKVFYI